MYNQEYAIVSIGMNECGANMHGRKLRSCVGVQIDYYDQSAALFLMAESRAVILKNCSNPFHDEFRRHTHPDQ
jgi:hypothetical protein